jgi:hypothetical protein
MEVTATLTNHKGETKILTGTSGMMVTTTRNGNDMNVQMEFNFASREETIAAIGTLLTQLEEISGENFVAQCIVITLTRLAKYSNDQDREI